MLFKSLMDSQIKNKMFQNKPKSAIDTFAEWYNLGTGVSLASNPTLNSNQP